MQTLTGRCLCEAISYKITGELGPIFNCHCSKCRRWHGAAFRTRASVKKDQFSWTSGESLLSFYETENVIRTFCSICGSNLISLHKNYPNIIGLALGGLEQDPGNRPEGNLFIDSKAPWYTPCDGLPQYAEWPPESEEKVRETK